MEIRNEFAVGVPPSEAWKVLTDLERVARSMPGAQLAGVDGDEYRGTVKIKLGAVTTQYKGVARIVEADEDALKAVLKAEGRDSKGQGRASATVAAVLSADGDGTKVLIDTDLSITGRVAQFGRGVMVEVSSKLMEEFARRLEADLSGKAEEPALSSPAAGASPEGSGTNVPADGQVLDETSRHRRQEKATGSMAGAAGTVDGVDGGEAIDLMALAGGSMAKRILPLGITTALLLMVPARKLRHRLALAAAGIAMVALESRVLLSDSRP